MFYKKYLLLVSLFPSAAIAQDKWTLKACVEYGLKNHRSNIVYANEKKAADEKAKEARAAYLPQIKISGQLDDNVKPQVQVIPGGVLGSGAGDLKVAFTKRFNSVTSAELNQTIYDQTLITGLRANRYNSEVASLNEKQNQEAIIYNVSTSYYQIFVYRQQLALQAADQQNYFRQRDVLELQVRKGVTLQKDLDKVTVDLNNTTAKINIAKSNITLAENQLKYDMGYPISGSIAIDSADVALMTPEIQQNDSLSFSPKNRTDFQISMNNAMLDQIDAQRIRAGGLPTLSAYARYGFLGFSDNIGQAYNNLNPFFIVGLKMNFPIFDFFKRNAQYAQAKIKAENDQQNLKLDEGKYQLEYENARYKLQKQRGEVEDNKRNISLAQSVFHVTDLQYQKGTVDLVEWLSATNSLKEAQNNYLESLYNFLLARMDMVKANGTLKSFYTSL